MLGLAVAGCSAAPPAPPPQSLGTAIDRPVPRAILDLPLTTASGARTSLGAYRGKIVVLGDFLSLCQEICPMTSANFTQMARSASAGGNAGKVVFLEVTVDPQRDTAARLAAYRKLFDAPSEWVLATGTPADLAQLWKFFGVFYQRTDEDSPSATDWLTGQPLTYDVAHQDAVVFLDAAGHERFLILGNPDTHGAPLPTTLQRFLSDQGRTNLADPGQLAWTPTNGQQVVTWLAQEQIGR
ncbi:MAG: SCO family protein [Pseudonocardiaceae bacterium]